MIKVLYVEDDETHRNILVQMLERYGYEVDVACSGEEGVKKAREWRPHVVLMDIRMPGRIDGIMATRQLRKGLDALDIPVIVITGWDSARNKWRALQAGADAHLTKPVPMLDLVAAINRSLR